MPEVGVAQRAAAEWWSDTIFGLKANDESNHNGWKKFDAATARFTVTYNSYPNAPDGLTVSGRPCATGDTRPYVRTLTPELRARLTDPDGFAAPLTGTFWWWPLGGSSNGNDSVRQDAVTSGGQAVATVPGGRLVDGQSYVFHARTYDGIDDGQHSTQCEFTVDATPPNVPSNVSSTTYPSGGQLNGGTTAPTAPTACATTAVSATPIRPSPACRPRRRASNRRQR